MRAGLAPRWASAPGETIQSILRERHLGIEHLATALEISRGEAQDLLVGRATINAERAGLLSRAFGGSARFWLTREAEYAEDRLRVLAADWSTRLPITSMRNLGWLPATRHWQDLIDECLKFFDVSDIEEWMASYPQETKSSHYRMSATLANDEYSTLVWLRAGDRELPTREPQAQFDSNALRRSIPDLRRLTRIADPVRFIPELQRIANHAGLIVLVVPSRDGCRVSGATRWRQGKPIIQLSARHLSDDHFWFTLFHEIGHVLCHGDHQGTFIDVDMKISEDDDSEREADRFAESVILSGADEPELLRRTSRDIIRAAARIGISPGLLVGQLQHYGHLSHDELNSLKRRYRWDGTTLTSK